MRRLVEEIDERVDAVFALPIEGGRTYVWIDASCINACEAGRIISTATKIAMGVNTDGRREVRGVASRPSEA